MPGDGASTAEALEADLLFKEGEGFPGAVFTERLEVFQANRSV